MRFGKTLLFGVSLYAMRTLLRRARGKKAQPAPASADFADTQPITRWMPNGDEGMRSGTPGTRR